MNRYLLDTNILIFLILSELDNISDDTKEILTDYNNQLNTSAIAVAELIQLYRIKKIQTKKYKTATELCDAIEKEYFIKILPFTKQHTETLSKLRIPDGHNDPFDHSIISQAITDKLTLVSSDRKFDEYTSQNLLFAFNKR
jgi:tRNA(fMet)-specific endonuclease VapC